MRLAGSDDFKIELMKGAADDPALVSLADLGSQSYSPTALNADDYYYGFRRQLDDDLGQLSARFVANKEKEKEKKVTVKPVDTKTDGRKFTENLYGGETLTDEELTWRMKLNPATTPEDWARAFGKCRTTRSSDKHASIPSDCYWPEEGGLEGSDFYSVGGGGRKSGHGQSAPRKSNVSGRKTNTKTNRRGHNSAGSGMSNRSRSKSKK